MTRSHPKRRTHDLALSTVLALLGSLAMAPADAQTAADCITIEVQNVRPKQGHLMAAAYDSAETYGKTPMAVARVPAGDATTRFELCGGHRCELRQRMARQPYRRPVAAKQPKRQQRQRYQHQAAANFSPGQQYTQKRHQQRRQRRHHQTGQQWLENAEFHQLL